MTPSPWLYDFLRGHIPFRPTAWRRHKRDACVIGFAFPGAHQPGVEVVAGATITMEEAEKLLRSSIDTAAVAVELANAGRPMGQGAFDVAVALLVAGCQP